MPSSRGLSQLRDPTQVSHIAGGFFTVWATRKPGPYNSVQVPSGTCFFFPWDHWKKWRRKGQPTPVFLLGESCGQRSLVGCLLSVGSPRGRHDWSDLACMHALEKEMATHSSILAWRITGTEEPGGLPSMGSHRVWHDWRDLAPATATAIKYMHKMNTCKNLLMISM